MRWKGERRLAPSVAACFAPGALPMHTGGRRTDHVPRARCRRVQAKRQAASSVPAPARKPLRVQVWVDASLPRRASPFVCCSPANRVAPLSLEGDLRLRKPDSYQACDLVCSNHPPPPDENGRFRIHQRVH
eukprot:4623714-Pleurochrysis_carterae.AAC.1